MTNQSTVKKPGILFKIVVVLFFLGIAFFLFMIFYYTWQLRYGDAEKVTAQFSEQFTKSIDLSKIKLNSLESIDQSKIIRSHNPKLGQPDSDVTIVAFIDFECPFCKRSHPTFNKIIDQYTPGIQIVFKHLPLVSIHPNSLSAAHAAACADEQGKFWPYYDLLFSGDLLDESTYIYYANSISLDTNKFSNCLSSQTYAKDIKEDLDDAISLGVRGTPTYFLNGKKIEGVITKELWDSLIFQALQQ